MVFRSSERDIPVDPSGLWDGPARVEEDTATMAAGVERDKCGIDDGALSGQSMD